MKTILVTGGLGYIVSHICIDLLENNYNIIIVDNMSNSSIEKLEVIKKYNKFNKNNKRMYIKIQKNNSKSNHERFKVTFK